MFGYLKRRRRERLRAAAFPPEWDQTLRGNVPLYGRLNESDREELRGHVQVFLDPECRQVGPFLSSLLLPGPCAAEDVPRL